MDYFYNTDNSLIVNTLKQLQIGDGKNIFHVYPANLYIPVKYALL